MMHTRELAQIVRGMLAAIALSSIALTGVAAQTPGTSSTDQKTTLTTLKGCVAIDAKNKKTFTLADGAQGQTYTLKGVDVRDFVGKQVEVSGSVSKGLRVVGGLYPSPNVAAQAGAIDPTRAAIASQSGPTANMPKPPIEFQVKSVRAAAGTCPTP